MAIKVKNYKNLESISYSLPLLEGEVFSSIGGEIHVKNKTENTAAVTWPVINNKFKALIHLVPGRNDLCLKHELAEVKFILIYVPMKYKKFVRLVYIKCKDDDGTFQAPLEEDNSINSACCRISLAAQMIQMFTAEKLKEHGLQRKTFCLEEDENGHPICHIFNSNLSVDEAHQLSDDELWSHFAKELMTSRLREGNDCKFLGFLSFSQYTNNEETEPETFKDILKRMKGHVALGGGGLALFGSACLHTWAQKLQEVPWRFADTRIIDRKIFMDDSGNRGWYWACYATGLGAALHELGHTFDLGHTNGGIMGRGFDDIHKFFTLDASNCDSKFQWKYNPHFQKSKGKKQSVQVSVAANITWSSKQKEVLPQKTLMPPKKSSVTCTSKTSLGSCIKEKQPWKLPDPPETVNDKKIYSIDNGGAYWCRSSALILYYHKWLNPVINEESQNNISISETKLSSPHGLRIIEFRDEEGTAFHHLEFADGDGEIEIDLCSSDISHHLPVGTKEVSFIVEDSLGNIAKYRINCELLT